MATLALALAAPLAGCAQQLKVETQYADHVDYSKYETYRWVTDDLVLIRAGSGDPAIRTLENEKRIRAAVERELAEKGLEKVDGEDAQLAIAFTVGTKVHYKLSGAGGNDLDILGEGDSVTRGTLTIYVFDRASGEQIWSAWTKKDLERGTDPDALIAKAVALLLDAFPR